MNGTDETFGKLEKELEYLTHVLRNGTVSLQSLLRQIEEVLNNCSAAVKTVRAEIEAIIQEDI